jgi:peptide/nickel transport system substrate-binding protein
MPMTRTGRDLALPALAGLALLAGAAIAPAQAQKAKDTLRLAYADPISTVVEYDDTKPETGTTARAVFDTLMCFDREKAEFTPLLAKSWTRIDDKTLEFKLRDDVVFHDGTKFSADDVVYTLNWVIDPKSKVRYADTWFGWMARAEKVDDYTVRVIAKEVTPVAMLQLAVPANILPAKLHASYDNRADFGRTKPVGTGPYKVVSISPDNGIVLARNDNYHHGNYCKPAAAVGNIHVLLIPDRNTQIAQLSIGGIDLIHTHSKDEPEMLAGNPDLTVTTLDGENIQYLILDALGRAGNPALTDPKVRQAIAMAIDRGFVARNAVAGGEATRAVDALCVKTQVACDFSSKPPDYDPTAAKALLAKAGYPEGFTTEIAAQPGSYELAEAISGQLRKIGILATVNKQNFAAFRQKQVEGKSQIMLGGWPIRSELDAGNIVGYLFDGSPRDYSRDPLVLKLGGEAAAILDLGKRKALYRQLFDRVNAMNYVVPIATIPDVVVHSKDLVVNPTAPHAKGFSFIDVSWK